MTQDERQVQSARSDAPYQAESPRFFGFCPRGKCCAIMITWLTQSASNRMAFRPDMKITSHSLLSCTFSFLGIAAVLCCLLPAPPARGAEEKKTKVVEIKVREIDPAAAAKVSYARQIKPILVDNCLECHSTKDHKGGLDATSVASLIKGGKKASPAIIPGQPDQSALGAYLRGLKEPQMPKGSPPLSEEELHLVRLWIFAGAKDDSEEVLAEKKSSASDLQALYTVPATNNDPATQKALNALFFSANNEERLF